MCGENGVKQQVLQSTRSVPSRHQEYTCGLLATCHHKRLLGRVERFFIPLAGGCKCVVGVCIGISDYSDARHRRFLREKAHHIGDTIFPLFLLGKGDITILYSEMLEEGADEARIMETFAYDHPWAFRVEIFNAALS